ncbi:MAG: glycosyltransferase family 39 protein [Saprospiraceae bacterium]|nr:glycosyltransferase family 39 protein [Saprospiraceae bacterium]
MAKSRLLLLLGLILFFFCAAPFFVQKSMYNDGIWYACIAKNLADGIGSFWNPQLTSTIFPSFHEHPPLVFGIQSLFFSLFGSSILVERLYALFIFLFSAWLIVRIWKKGLAQKLELASLWPLPLIFWLLNEVIYLFYPGNVLEPTMGAFTLLSFYFLWIAAEKKELKQSLLFLALGALALVGATLCKGFVGLFPLAVLFLHWVVFRSMSFLQMTLRSVILIALLVVTYLVLLADPVALQSLEKYIDSQVFASINAERTAYHHRDSRLYIIKRLLEVSFPSLILTGLLLYPAFKKKIVILTSDLSRIALFYSLIGVSASFPLMVSPKQSFYYLLPAIPFFALAMATLVAPIVREYLLNLDERPGRFRSIQVALSILLLVGIIFTISKIGTISKRDKVSLPDIEMIGTVVPQGSTVGAKAYTAQLVGYLYRKYEIKIDTNAFDYEYLILDGEKGYAEPNNFSKALQGTKRFHLYHRQ